MIWKRLVRPTELFRRYFLYIGVVCGGLVLGFLIINEWRAYVAPVLGGTLGCLLAIFVPLSADGDTNDNPLDWRVSFVGTSAFVVLSVVIYRVAPLWERPAAHVALLGIIGGFVTYQVMRGGRDLVVVTQILVVAAVTYWVPHLAFPAGLRGADTEALLPVAVRIAQIGMVPEGASYGKTPGHMVYTVMGGMLFGIDTSTMYYALSYVPITVAIGLISVSHRYISTLSRQHSHLAGYFTAFSAFTLRRGQFVAKLTFFTAFLVLVGYGVFWMRGKQGRTRWLILIGTAWTALLFSHTYTSWAALSVAILIVTIHEVYRNADGYAMSSNHIRLIPVFLSAMGVAYVGYALETNTIFITAIRDFLSALVSSSPSSSGSVGGGGRYSDLPLIVTAISTASQFLMFLLAGFGINVGLQQREWTFDSFLAVFIAGIGMIFISLIVSGVAIPTPRIYWLIVIFGLNVFMAVGVLTLNTQLPGGLRRLFVPSVVSIFVIFAIVSPVAGTTLSVYDNKIPHVKMYDTEPSDAGVAFVSSHAGKSETLTMDTPSVEAPTVKRDSHSAWIDRSRIRDGNLYAYDWLAREDGAITNVSGLQLGGREYRFVYPPEDTRADGRVYDNGWYWVFKKGSAHPDTS